MGKIRVILADDHAILREGLKYLLESSGQVEVIGEASNGREAVDLATSLQPDVVVMDIAMRDLNGVDATRLIKQAEPQVKVLVLSMYATEQYVSEIVKAGASGYLVKEAAGEELLKAISTVAEGGVFLHPTVAAKLLNQFRKTPGQENMHTILTSREREILQLIAEGISSRDIAERLHVSVHTVRAHRVHIMEKLGLHNTAELVQYAIRIGLVQP